MTSLGRRMVCRASAKSAHGSRSGGLSSRRKSGAFSMIGSPDLGHKRPAYDKLRYGLGAPSTVAAIAFLAATLLGAAPTRAYPPDYPSVLQYGIAPVTSTAAESSHIFCTTQCSVWSLVVTSGAVAGYVLTFNAVSAPADGAVTPVDCVVLPANSTVSISYDPGPSDYMTTGYTAVFSSTGCLTKTASATAIFKGRVSK